MIAVSDVSGGVACRGRARRPDAARVRRRARLARGLRRRTRFTNAELLELPCDVLVLAAREDQVTAANAANLRCRLRRRGRERARRRSPPTRSSPSAASRSCPTCSRTPAASPSRYFEWVQDLGRLFWDRDEIRGRLAEKLGDAFDRVWELPSATAISLRNAALVAGIREVAAALEARGIYP